MPEIPFRSDEEEKNKVLDNLVSLSAAVIEEHSLELNDVDQYSIKIDLTQFGTAEKFVQEAQRAINLGLEGISIEHISDDPSTPEEALHQQVIVAWNPDEFAYR